MFDFRLRVFDKKTKVSFLMFDFRLRWFRVCSDRRKCSSFIFFFVEKKKYFYGLTT